MKQPPPVSLPAAFPPLSSLDPKTFEDMCEVLLQRRYGTRVVRNGRSGQKQHGCDIIVLEEGGTIQAFDCKRYERLTPTLVRSWVAAFLRGDYADRASTFTILTAARDDARVTEAVAEEAQRLRGLPNPIDLRLGGAIWFDHEFVESPEVAGRFFHHSWTSTYVERGQAAQLERERQAQRVRSVIDRDYKTSGGYIHLAAALPNAADPAISAELTFQEIGFRESVIELDNDDLLKVFDESSWLRGFPFVTNRSAGHETLKVGNVSFSVSSKSAEQLRTVIRELRGLWNERIALLDKAWDTAGYQFVNHFHGVRIGKMDAGLWRLLLDFAIQHDYADGKSDWHIFDGRSTAFIKVFAPAQRGELGVGFHMTLESDPPVLWRIPSDDSDVNVIWHPPFRDDVGYWGAGAAAKWLTEVLIPSAIAWRKSRRHKPRPGPRAKYRWRASVDSWRNARAKTVAPASIKSPTDLRRYLDRLQRHYHLAWGRFPAALGRACDNAVAALFGCTDLKQCDADYVSGNLHIAATNVAEMAREAKERTRRKAQPIDGRDIDGRLSAMTALVESSVTPVPEAIASAVATLLSPLAAELNARTCRMAHRRVPVPPELFPE